MPEKNIADTIQSMLEKNNGFMTVSRLALLMGQDARHSLGIKTNDTNQFIKDRIAQFSEGRFIFRAKGKNIFVLIPFDPYEFVLSFLSEDKPFDGRKLSGFPFSKAEFAAMINELADSGKVKIILSDTLSPKIFKAHQAHTHTQHPESETEIHDGVYTQEKFREALKNLDAEDGERIFVRIPDLRRKLNWPRSIFDSMVRDLRNNQTIGVYTADESTMTDDEIKDCFIDENNFRMGTVTWNAR